MASLVASLVHPTWVQTSVATGLLHAATLRGPFQRKDLKQREEPVRWSHVGMSTIIVVLAAWITLWFARVVHNALVVRAHARLQIAHAAPRPDAVL